MRLLVLRPQPGADDSAARIAAGGASALVAPLFAAGPVDWTLPAVLPAAVMLTSAQAARLAGVGLCALADLPCHCVGAATASAARVAGFTDVHAADGDARRLLDAVADAGIPSILHLAGRDHRAVDDPRVRIERRIVYAVAAADRLPPPAAEALRAGAIDRVLLHSPRAAALFARLLDAAGIDRADIALAAISPAALAEAGPGWRDAVAAADPTDAALLAAALGTCQKRFLPGTGA